MAMLNNQMVSIDYTSITGFKARWPMTPSIASQAQTLREGMQAAAQDARQVHDWICILVRKCIVT